MAQTEHLGLHQWEATDSFLRTDFNEDFAKIDGAVALAQAPAVVGSYTPTPGSSMELPLGFRPKMVLLLSTRSSGEVITVLLDGKGTHVYHDYTDSRAFVGGASGANKFTDTGFQIGQNDSYLNSSQVTGLVRYAAFR